MIPYTRLRKMRLDTDRQRKLQKQKVFLPPREDDAPICEGYWRPVPVFAKAKQNAETFACPESSRTNSDVKKEHERGGRRGTLEQITKRTAQIKNRAVEDN